MVFCSFVQSSCNIYIFVNLIVNQKTEIKCDFITGDTNINLFMYSQNVQNNIYGVLRRIENTENAHTETVETRSWHFVYITFKGKWDKLVRLGIFVARW